MLSDQEIIYDWNLVDSFHNLDKKKFSLLDETLRDGLQSPSVVNPTAVEKFNLVLLMESLGIEHVNIGLPGAGDQAFRDVLYIAREIKNNKLKIKPACAARTLENDIKPIVEVSQAAGIEIEVMSFIGSSPIRQLAEEWDIGRMLEFSRNAITFAVREGLPVTFVTEDTTRSRPDTLYKLFCNAIDCGAKRVCLCDTTGHSTPDGIRALMRFVMNLIQGLGVNIGIDWHGHNDRGMSLSNSLWALQFGADRVHGTAIGVGERVGNTPLDQLIMNLRLLGAIPPERNLTKLVEYCRYASEILSFPIPKNYPLAGEDAFKTATGVHASALLKAQEKGNAFLADRVYSGVPAGMFGRFQKIEIGPMSGASNVIYYLRSKGIEPDDEIVARILARAKTSNRILTDAEIEESIKI